MPWSVAKRGPRFAVVREDGVVVATHPTREKALRHQRALYANVPEARRASRHLRDAANKRK